MNANFVRSSCKNGYSMISQSLMHRHSTSELVGTPITHRFYQRRRAFFKSSNSAIFKKTRELRWRSSSISSKCSCTAVSWYLGMIKTRPILTKSVTSAVIYAAADFTSQMLTISKEAYDLLRTLRMGMYGFVILGPALHYWFTIISRILPNRDIITTLKKMVLGQISFGPLMTIVFFSTNAALQGESKEEIILRLKRDVVRTLITGLMYWPFCDFITFKYCPVHLQPLVCNSFSYLWTIYLTYMASLNKAAASKG